MKKTISDYTIHRKIYESRNSVVHRGRRESDGRPVILKMLRQDFPSPERIARFRREYEIAGAMELPGVPDVFDLITDRNRWIMVMDDFGGDALNLLGIAGRLSLVDFLALSIRIIDILGRIHQRHIIHKDINPSNIVMNPADGEVKIIDFGISAVLSREMQAFDNPGVLEGSLAYISPEQTGRMNRSLDYRTDFYSLGVSFYELITGRAPFQSRDPLEMVHRHIADEPAPPIDRMKNQPGGLKKYGCPDVLNVISDIVMKLMAKNAEARYQSIVGLQEDLRACLNHIRTREGGDASESSAFRFTIGRRDVSDRFSIPQKLYGRDREIEKLLRAFARAAEGEKSLMLITGISGAGKSALVHEIHKPITGKRGGFLSGKFDQYQRNVPYFALTAAFNRFCDYLLTENPEKLAVWQKRIMDAVGENGQIL
ncbi:MAG: AAA family ATPase, partial [Desulfobacterales bacterium]|nr:AAA family ATPase [Desulfobacterales bacterium]